MFQSLFFTTIPLFTMVFTGYFFGKTSIFNQLDANTLLKLVGLIILPTLGVKIIGGFRYEFINWDLYFCYLAGQVTIYFFAFTITKIVFKRNNCEAIIVAMTSSFSNHLWFVYPIALFEFGPQDVVPIETIISADFITVGLSVCALDVMSKKETSIVRLAVKQIKNPALLGLFLGLVVYWSDFPIPLSIERLVDFICDAGTPCALIAMGILLSFRTDTTQIKLAVLITALKVFVFPIIVTSIVFLAITDVTVSRTTLMVSAAPIGSMGLIFASLYNVQTGAVVRAGIFTYILALLTVPFVGTLI